MSDLQALQAQLKYKFSDQGLLQQAMTHRSAASENYERLEFLGDSVLNFLVARRLYELKPTASEGDLSRLRATLVKQEALAAIGETIELGRYLILGQGERKSGGHRRHSILADCLESLLGAVLLDGGIEACSLLVDRLYRSHFATLPDTIQLKDSKSLLQEHLQKFRKQLPVYKIVEISGQDHDQYFRISCSCQLTEAVTFGEASSRKIAEQQAADEMLRILNAKPKCS